jgi:hypothetical protein
MKILMTVHHGETKTEIANGSSFKECLAYLSQTPLYKGYGPALSDMTGLEIHGKMSFGWADYKFYNDEQIAELLE